MDPLTRFRPTVILIAFSISLAMGCSRPSEPSMNETVPSAKDSPTAIPTRTRSAPTGPIELALPNWVRSDLREDLVSLAKGSAGDREVLVLEPGRKTWAVGLFPGEDPAESPDFPWIEEKLNLYVNKVFLARAGVPSVPKTWDEALSAVDQKGQIEGLTAFFALPGNSQGMFRSLSLLAALCGANSFSHPEEESVCMAVQALGDLYRKGDFVLDHDKGFGPQEPMAELGRGKAAMTLAWESEALILDNTQTASVSDQITAASPPAFLVHGSLSEIQPTRRWAWRVASASAEDGSVVQIARTFSEWRGAELLFGRYVEPSSSETSITEKRGLFRLDPPNDHAVRETRRILLEGWNAKKTGLEILQGIQIRYESIREHDRL